MIIPPYPYTLEDPADVPLEDAWYARPELFFSCWFRPADGRPPSQGNYTRGTTLRCTWCFLAHSRS